MKAPPAWGRTRPLGSQKLAALGQLTAGIAHEIKNPLNFVNNFADVSTELLSELADAVRKAPASESFDNQTAISEEGGVRSRLLLRKVGSSATKRWVLRLRKRHRSTLKAPEWTVCLVSLWRDLHWLVAPARTR
jgi:signal transduction histidine kinase